MCSSMECSSSLNRSVRGDVFTVRRDREVYKQDDFYCIMGIPNVEMTLIVIPHPASLPSGYQVTKLAKRDYTLFLEFSD
jgi:hypothetical protein